MYYVICMGFKEVSDYPYAYCTKQRIQNEHLLLLTYHSTNLSGLLNCEVNDYRFN